MYFAQNDSINASKAIDGSKANFLDQNGISKLQIVRNPENCSVVLTTSRFSIKQLSKSMLVSLNAGKVIFLTWAALS